MPYIITTISGTGDGWPCNTPSGFAEIKRAVATLEEARQDIRDAIDAGINASPGRWMYEAREALRTLTESGGTIGPLPDGTVIEVERVLWGAVGYVMGGRQTPDEALADYNAQHAHA